MYLEILLRELTDPNYSTKGSELTFEELDTNFKLLADALQALGIQDTSSFDDYDPGFTYQGTETYYAAYDGNIWKFVSPFDQTGITPGTDSSVWMLASSGVFAHVQNTDTILAEGTADEVSAAEIRAFIDGSTSGGAEVTDVDVIALMEDDSDGTWTDNRYTGTTPITGYHSGDFYINGIYDYKFYSSGSEIRRIYYKTT